MSLIKQLCHKIKRAVVIEEKDALIKQYHKQLEKIQERLNITMLTSEQRMELETEVNDIKDELNKLEKELKGLRKENFRSLILAATLLILIFLVYYFLSPV
ncbi:uncharacterized protein LOC111088481 isoform X1 [Limulus polyphemus]|uniref:Coiled-coil domain-containing protein 167 n=1 Tax=Limulus polyphemus TaxID=6850 RepID=A0ABM1TEZ0_LIMPO|nr:uncharacterized protein LOC111088481 isoform X1 [Limulus polyphemus]XP_022254446.1 uncharacterized protein LOC111088481 isoform X1 [Limulus polyphemus]